MILVADESVDQRIIRYLRSKAFEVFSIFEEARGVSDTEVLKIAFQQEGLLITQDKDFGNLVINLGLNHHGILLLRFGSLTVDEKIAALEQVFIHNLSDFRNNFAVLDDKQLRIRRL